MLTALYTELNDKTASAKKITVQAVTEGLDAYLSEGSIKVASLDDLFSFDRVANDKLIHKSTQDLWSINTDKDGNVLIQRMFDNSGEPVKG